MYGDYDFISAPLNAATKAIAIGVGLVGIAGITALAMKALNFNAGAALAVGSVPLAIGVVSVIGGISLFAIILVAVSNFKYR
ncbi:hypothetical protein N9Y92_01570 [Chlamydiales bacterium]|nr:hypothetical protein [Chlamydiales bacterium]